MVKKLIFLVLGVLVISLLMTSVALAATPQDIYDDYAADGDLDGTYTDAELQAYLDDATIHQYGDPSVVGPLDDLVADMLTRDEFPFTGFQMLIAGIVAVVLVAGGIGLRRLSRPQKS
jgi:hypothetical protein